MESISSSADQDEILVIRPYRTLSIAYLISALISLLPLAFGLFEAIHITVVYAIASICSFLPGVTFRKREGIVRKLQISELPVRRQLAEFKVVTIAKTKGHRGCYRVGLEGQVKPLSVFETKDYTKARNYSESIASFLELNIRDEALGRTTFHRRKHSGSVDSQDPFSRRVATAEPELDRTTILSGLEGNQALEIRREIGFEVYLNSVLVFVMAVSVAAVAPPVQGFVWMAIMMQEILALLLIAGVWGFLSRRGGTILVADYPYLLTWKALRLRRLMKIRRVCEFDRVALSLEERLSDKGKRAEFHCIRLDGESAPVTILETKDDTRARKVAAQVSEFLALPIDDFMERDPEKAVLRNRFLPTDADRTLAPPPPGISLEFERRGDEFVFKIPARGYGVWKLPLIVGMLLPVITIGLVVAFEAGIWRPPPPQWLQAWLWAVCIISCLMYLPLLLALILPFMRRLSRREQIHVSPQAIRVRSRALEKNTDRTLPAGELSDVAIGRPTSKHLTDDVGGLFAPRQVIRACGTIHTLEFGGNLTRDERDWLRKAVIAILLADQPADG